MAIFKTHKTDDYTVMSNSHLRDKELSLKTKGLLSLMLSLPDTWEYSIVGLSQLSKDGKDSVMSALDDLCEKGYVKMSTHRNAHGQYETQYDIYETPQTDAGSPMRENRFGFSESVNPPQLNTNNKILKNIIVEDAHTHTREKSDFDYVLEWICDNEDGLQQMLYRNKLILAKTPVQEMIEIIHPYVQEYYEQQLMNGGEDITRRGRRDIKQHFSQWLPKHLKKLQQEQQQKQQEYEQGIDPITRAMQDFAAGWDNAERRKQQEQCFECF
jgi:hypothetical protein